MMTLKRVFLLSVLLICISCVFAQRDTVQTVPSSITLGKVEVRSSKKLKKSATTWDGKAIKTTVGITVSDLLQQSSGVYVKSYGSGGLATVSIRGAGGGRSSTTWNGMPLLGATLGLLDYSLLNAGMFEGVSLSLGGDAGRHGSGAIGGNVSLENKNLLNWKEGYNVGIRSVLGSYGRYHQGVNYSVHKKKWWATTRLSLETARQNFTYKVRDDLPERINTHGARDQVSLLQSIGYQVNDKNDIEVHFWAQYNLREIPPTTVQNSSEATVRDKFARIQAIWNHTQNDRLTWKTIAAATVNQNIFNDPLNLVEGNNLFYQSYLKSLATYKKGNGVWSAGMSNRYTEATTNNYTIPKMQNVLALFPSYTAKYKNWEIDLSAREELLGENFSPITGRLEVGYTFTKNWKIGASANRHYRNPGLNDLHWSPGGDASLEAESGWSQELKLEFRNKEKLKLGLGIFNSRINNWIQWGLLDEQNFFSALNLPQVWSRGLEGNVAWVLGSAERKLTTHISYTYNLATYQFDLKNPRLNFGDMVFYTPAHRVVGTIVYQRPKYEIRYMHSLQSGITTSIGPLGGFDIGDLHLNYTYKDANIFFTIQNIWNTSYRVIERRPMPGRNYTVGINLDIFNLFKNKI